MKLPRPALISLASLTFAAACSFVRGPAGQPSTGSALFPFQEEGRLSLPAGTSDLMLFSRGTLYLSTEGGEVLAVDPGARRVLWRFQTGSAAEARLEPWSSGVMAISGRGVVELLDAGGGLVTRLETGETLLTAAWSEGRLYCAADGGRLLCFDVGTGSRLWELKLDAPVASGPLVEGGCIVVGDACGRLTAARPDGRVLWTFRAEGMPVPGAVSGTAPGMRPSLYFGTTERLLYCLSAATGKKRWALRLGGAPAHEPVVSGKLLFLTAANSVLYCLSAKSGEVKWWQPVRSRLVGPPVVARELGLVLASGDLASIEAYDQRSGAKTGEVRAGDCPPAALAWTGSRLVVLKSAECESGPELVFLRPKAVSLR
jgi:outer membrane protein assembly factor BamB